MVAPRHPDCGSRWRADGLVLLLIRLFCQNSSSVGSCCIDPIFDDRISGSPVHPAAANYAVDLSLCKTCAGYSHAQTPGAPLARRLSVLCNCGDAPTSRCAGAVALIPIISGVYKAREQMRGWGGGRMGVAGKNNDRFVTRPMRAEVYTGTSQGGRV
ncbi:hypothetical protein VUR80DRAFT_3684 [Thermomyces stellatus]